MQVFVVCRNSKKSTSTKSTLTSKSSKSFFGGRNQTSTEDFSEDSPLLDDPDKMNQLERSESLQTTDKNENENKNKNDQESPIRLAKIFSPFPVILLILFRIVSCLFCVVLCCCVVLEQINHNIIQNVYHHFVIEFYGMNHQIQMFMLLIMVMVLQIQILVLIIDLFGHILILFIIEGMSRNSDFFHHFCFFL